MDGGKIVNLNVQVISTEEVRAAMTRMTFFSISDCLKQSWRVRGIPERWRGTLVPNFKDKGDAQSCCNYRGIKLMSHTMKLLDSVV